MSHTRTAHGFPATGTAGSAWRAAEEYGLDMTLVAEALERPVWERMTQHQAALDSMSVLRKAYLDQYGGPAADY